MIQCHFGFLAARCVERGYTLDEVAACIVSRDGDTITVDTDHSAYPRVSRLPAGGAACARCGGVGTELKKMLGRIGIRSSPSCKCNARAREMDARGVQWTADNLETVVGWLREESQRRKLPFVAPAARLLVKAAIRNARKAGYV
jgi:hypothetical protein